MTDRIEAAARVLHDRFAVGTTLTWEDASPLTKDRYRADARAMLAAADTAATQDDDYIADIACVIYDKINGRSSFDEIVRATFAAVLAAGAGTPGEAERE